MWLVIDRNVCTGQDEIDKLIPSDTILRTMCAIIKLHHQSNLSRLLIIEDKVYTLATEWLEVRLEK